MTLYARWTPNRTGASIKNTFGITATGTAGVTATFNAVHDYLQSRTAAQVASEAQIQPGDYIDLESLSVAGYPTDDMTSGYGKLTNQTNTDLGDHGTLLRLIVVGINSFNAQGSYTGNDNGNDAHIVFQFQNLPVTRRVEASPTNANGYLGSEMRKYLVEVGGVGGNFLAGLFAAGVPQSVLWAPVRSVASYGGSMTAPADQIQDLLWLPTQWELFGNSDLGMYNSEVAANQARLEYYNDDSKRIKYDNSSTTAQAWWLASPSTLGSYFMGVSGMGAATLESAQEVRNCAPAFCVN